MHTKELQADIDRRSALERAQTSNSQGKASAPRLCGDNFDKAIKYIAGIKKRFESDPETYTKFLHILHTHQKEPKSNQKHPRS